LKLGKNEIWNRRTVMRGFEGESRSNSYWGLNRKEKYYMDILDIDTVNHIIVGTFDFKANGNHKIETISDGEFDLNYSI